MKIERDLYFIHHRFSYHIKNIAEKFFKLRMRKLKTDNYFINKVPKIINVNSKIN